MVIYYIGPKYWIESDTNLDQGFTLRYIPTPLLEIN